MAISTDSDSSSGPRSNGSTRDTDSNPTGRATVRDVSDKIDDARALSAATRAELVAFKEAMVGIPGVTLGALGEIRKDAQDNKALIEQTLAAQLKFQADLPAIIDTAINGKLRQRMVNRANRLGQFGTTVLGMVASGVLVAVVILIFHLGSAASTAK